MCGGDELGPGAGLAVVWWSFWHGRADSGAPVLELEVGVAWPYAFIGKVSALLRRADPAVIYNVGGPSSSSVGGGLPLSSPAASSAARICGRS